jgi:hypothetical protein
MIDNVLKDYKYVKTYNRSKDVPQSVIDDLLQRTWKVTPSKNNFMPYKLHVLGPQHQDLKDKVYEKALKHQDDQDHLTVPSLKLPRFHNIVSCHYLLIFTQRVEDQPNAHQQELIALGRNYTQTDPNKLGEHYGNALLEIGMFCNTFAGLCIESKMDISYTLCFPKQLDQWQDDGFEFLDQVPIFIMTAGKAQTYLQDEYTKKELLDLRPNYDRIVNFVK